MENIYFQTNKRWLIPGAVLTILTVLFVAVSTENDEGGYIQYFVSTYNKEEQSLLQLGAPKAPRAIQLLPGSVNDHLPVYRQVWFWSSIVSIIGGAVASYFIIKDQTELEGRLGGEDRKVLRRRGYRVALLGQ